MTKITKIINVSMVLLMSSSMLSANDDQMKKYDIESGRIEYAIKGSSDMMGMKMKTIGKKRVLFTDYGIQDLTENNQITKQTMSGQTKNTKTHTMVYMKNGTVYTVDFDSKRISRIENMGAAMGAFMGDGQNIKQSGEAMMLKMGGKKTGTDKILGYNCDIWNLMGTKQCMYKGIPLKVETNMMGIINTEVATKIEFDISLSKDNFKLPDFPIYDMQGNKLDKSKLDAMDKQAKAEAAKSSDDMAELRKVMATAAKNAGIKDGERATQTQEEAMKSSMMEAMLPRMKQEILSEEKMMRFGYECLGKADTLKEANECNNKTNAMSGEQEEPFDEWNPETKKEILGFLDQYINEMVPCIKKAQSMQDAEQCMPQE